jgi:hypothetical protein
MYSLRLRREAATSPSAVCGVKPKQNAESNFLRSKHGAEGNPIQFKHKAEGKFLPA